MPMPARAVLSAALALACAAPAGADPAGLTARLSLGDRAGRAIAAPTAGQDVGIEVTLASAAGGDPPQGVRVEGWLRPVSATDLPCRAAAQSFRATRRIPTGGIDLNGILLVAFNQDGSFGITDPRLDLATANMVAAGHTGTAPPALVAADPAGQRVWLRDPASGAVRALAMDGTAETIGTPDLGPLLALVPDGAGGVWAAGPRGARRLDAGGPGPALPVEGALLGLRAAGPGALVAWTAGRLLLADRRSGAVIGAADPSGGIRAADAATLADGQGGFATVAAVLAADGESVRLVWADAPEAGQPPIALPAPATRVDIQPEGGRVLLWDAGGAVSVVDAVSGTLAGALKIHAGIGAVAFADRAAFLMAADGSAVTVLDLASLAPGTAPTLQRVPLGPPTDRPAARPEGDAGNPVGRSVDPPSSSPSSSPDAAAGPRAGRSANPVASSPAARSVDPPSSSPASSPDAAAAPRAGRLAAQPAGNPPDPAGSEGLLVSLAPAPRAIAVHPDIRTMFVIEARDSMGEAPPMTGGRLRGGRPERIAVLDRSFRETAPGRFATRATIPAPGPWELVLTTGIGGLSTCFRLDVAADPDADPAASPAPPARLVLQPGPAPVTGAASTIRLALADAQGNPLPLSGDPSVSVTSLELGWQGRALVTGAGAEAISARISLPVPGLYVVRVDGLGPVSPAILEVPR